MELKPGCNLTETDYWKARAEAAEAQVKILRSTRKWLAIFDIESGKAVVVERHDALGTAHGFRNVWIVDATPNAAVTRRAPGDSG